MFLANRLRKSRQIWHHLVWLRSPVWVPFPTRLVFIRAWRPTQGAGTQSGPLEVVCDLADGPPAGRCHVCLDEAHSNGAEF